MKSNRMLRCPSMFPWRCLRVGGLPRAAAMGFATSVGVFLLMSYVHIHFGEPSIPWRLQQNLQRGTSRTPFRRESRTTAPPPPPDWGLRPGEPSIEVNDSVADVSPELLKHTGPGRSKDSGRWEYVRSRIREVYVYSAFYDDRLSLESLPEVRLVSVVEVFPVNTTLYCHIRYSPDTNLKPRVGAARLLEIGFGAQRHNKIFRTYILSCPLPSRIAPSLASVVLTPIDRPTFLIPVEVATQPPQKLDFGACVSVSYWHFDPHRIVEWMEMMQILGVSEVTIYNNSLDDASSRVFQYYDQKGFVDFRQSHNFLKDDGEVTLHMHMTPVINDCMYRNMYRYRKMVVIDLDELIVPTIHRTLKQMLRAVERTTEHMHRARSYMFRNVYMFLDLPGADRKESPRLITMRHRRALPPSERGYAVKTIVDPLACTNCHNHVCWGLTSGYDKPGFLNEVPPYLGVNLHFKHCHLGEETCRQEFGNVEQNDVMLKYRDELIPRVSKVLADLNLEPL